MKLNSEQQQAVDHVNGPCIVTAIPGSGKTRTLTARVVNLVRNHNISPDSVLCLTFTNKAANEMRDRISAEIGNMSDKIWISTFHALCVAILRKYGHKIGLNSNFSIYDEKDQRDLMEKIVRMAEYEQYKLIVDEAVDFVNDLREDIVPISEYKGIPNDIVDFATKYMSTLDEFQAIDFSGLQWKAYELLVKHDDVREYLTNKFKYVLIDEAQDTNSIQYELVKIIALPHKNIFVVGDYDQCIKEGQMVWTDFKNGQPTEKKIEDIHVGSLVLSACGFGQTKTSKVLYKNRTEKKCIETQIATDNYGTISCTGNHHFFVKRGYCWESTERHFVYLMKKGNNFRIGTSQFYVRSKRSPGIRNGFSFRCQSEHADAGWIISLHKTIKDARTNEKLVSYKYGIPTEVFKCRNKRDMFSQEDLDNLHSSINSGIGALKLLEDKGLSERSPQWHKANLKGTKISTFNIYLLAGKNEHRYSIRSADKKFISLLEKNGFNFSHSHYDVRFVRRCEGSRKSLKQIWDIREKVLKMANQLGHYVQCNNRCKLLAGNSLEVVEAASVVPGDLLPVIDAHGKVRLEKVRSVKNLESSGVYYDLEVEGTHNFVTGGIIHSNSVFSWRGAKPENINRIKSDFEGSKEIVLPRNYRSTAEILSSAQSLIRNNSNATNTTLISERGAGHPVLFRKCDNPHHEADFVARSIKDLASHNSIKFNDFAILYRTNQQSKTLEEVFVHYGIPYKIVGGFSFFDRKEIKTTLAYLSFFINPNDTISFSKAISFPSRNVGTTTIGRLEKMCHANNINMIEACKQIDQIDGVNQKARSHIKDFVKAYDNFCDNSNNRKSLSEIATSVLADTGFYSHLSKQSETDDVSQKRIANVDELLLDIATYQNGNSSATLSDYLQSLQLMSDKEEDNNEGKVTLLTMHSAKGLEFRVVFIVGAEEGLIPHRQSKNIDEERRLMYVAMTRAMDLLNISYCTHRQSFNRYTKNTTMDSKGESMFLHEIRRQITN